MFYKHKKRSRKSWLIDSDSPKRSWKRNIGKSKKMGMISSKIKENLGVISV